MEHSKRGNGKVRTENGTDAAGCLGNGTEPGCVRNTTEMCHGRHGADQNHNGQNNVGTIFDTVKLTSHLLSRLTEKDKTCVVDVGRASPVRGVCSPGRATSHEDQATCGETSYQEGIRTNCACSNKEDHICIDYNTAEHNYSHSSLSPDHKATPSNESTTLPHDHPTTPVPLAEPACSATPTSFQVQIGDLLGDILQSRDQGVGLELAFTGEVGASDRVETRGEAPSSLLTMSCQSENEMSRHNSFPVLPLTECHTHSISDQALAEFSNHASSLLVEEEEQLMSVFNHRSFTDHFPFLPPSLFTSNWCSPYDPPRKPSSSSIAVDGLVQAMPHYNKTQGGSPLLAEGFAVRAPYQMQTRSRAKASVCGTSTRSYSISPSTFLDTSSPPPTGLGGVSLLTSPLGPPGGGLLANRLSQPVFPDEPEIVFHEIQLGPLHTTPANISTAPL